MEINIYTDGACIGNPGPGGWAAIVILENKKKVLHGDIKSRYIFGEDVIDGMNDFEVESHQITNKLNDEKFNLESTLPYKDFLKAIDEVIRVIESYDITTVRASVGFVVPTPTLESV